jgi:ferredoxin--NADP+ reductase
LSSQLNAIVVQRIEVSPGLIIMRVVPDGWELPDFEPGQYAVLALPGDAARTRVSDPERQPRPPDKLIKRAYSIASSSKAKDFMEFYVSLVPSGELTPRLFKLRSGDRVWLSPKAKGVFTLDELEAGRHIAFLATGTGLAPYMSMLRTHLVCGTPTHAAVLHGARHSWDLGYRSELMTLRQICSNFSYLPTISRPESEAAAWTGQTGYLQDLWRSGALSEAWGFAPTPETTDVFICGNPAMVDAMVAILAAEGYVEHSRRQPGQIHVERYW